MNAAPKNVEQIAVAAITGSPLAVSRQLVHVQADQVVAFTVERGAGRDAHAIADTLISLAPFVLGVLVERRRQTLETIVEALVPKLFPEPHELKEAALLARARTAVLSSGDWMTVRQISQAAGYSAINPSAQPGKWKREGAIFAIRHNGADYYPSFGLDADSGYRPRKSMAAVLGVLAPFKDSWGMAYWFQSANSFLGGKRPQDLLASAPQRVLAAAQDELHEVAHG